MNSKKIIVFVAGLPGSGKSVFADVASSMKIPVIVLGDVVREEVVKRGLEPTVENFVKVAQELREKIGLEAIAMLSLEKIVRVLEENCVVVVDGVRSLNEVMYIKTKTNAESIIVAIHSSPKTRFSRIKSRERIGDPKEWNEFVKRDFSELSWGLGNVIALADIVLINEHSLEEFKSKVKQFLNDVIKKWCI